ncbi:hypothetical protein CULT_160042 [[Clostridium] ultunense Esp]|nr:hypothetical protein CULT_160042 [[Clostridium] ultunense Esp]
MLESSYIEEYTLERVWTPIPTLTNTERSDVVEAQLLDGKVAVIVNGSPSALFDPITFFEYHRAVIATFLCWVRKIIDAMKRWGY